MSARYSVYFAPADETPLATFGQRTLRRDVAGKPFATFDNDYSDKHVAERLSATPAHYGFHATLKAPFSLNAESSESQLLADVEFFASQQSPILLDTLQPRKLDGFAALTLEPDSLLVNQLASDCVERFERYRAPLREADIRRKLNAGLNELQRDYLNRYGYPYVKSEFRFHMTLTGKLDVSIDLPYTHWLEEQYRALVPSPPTLDRLAVFFQADRESAFVRMAEFEFTSSA